MPARHTRLYFTTDISDFLLVINIINNIQHIPDIVRFILGPGAHHNGRKRMVIQQDLQGPVKPLLRRQPGPWLYAIPWPQTAFLVASQ